MIIIEHNVETNEIIEREMTQEEIANIEIAAVEAEAKVAVKQAILNKLGITEDEAKLLLS